MEGGRPAVASRRLTEPLKRCPELEAIGAQPIRRTLGSRFRVVKSSREVVRKGGRGLPSRWT